MVSPVKVIISFSACILLLSALFIGSCMYLLHGSVTKLPEKQWTYELPSGAKLQLTTQVTKRTGWGTDSSGTTSVVYYPHENANPEEVGIIPYELRPTDYSRSLLKLSEVNGILILPIARRVFIRQDEAWTVHNFSFHSFPDQENSLLDGRIDRSSNIEGSFSILGVDENAETLNVRYSAEDILLVYDVVPDDEPLKLVEIRDFE